MKDLFIALGFISIGTVLVIALSAMAFNLFNIIF